MSDPFENLREEHRLACTAGLALNSAIEKILRGQTLQGGLALGFAADQHDRLLVAMGVPEALRTTLKENRRSIYAKFATFDGAPGPRQSP